MREARLAKSGVNAKPQLAGLFKKFELCIYGIYQVPEVKLLEFVSIQVFPKNPTTFVNLKVEKLYTVDPTGLPVWKAYAYMHTPIVLVLISHCIGIKPPVLYISNRYSMFGLFDLQALES